MGHNKIAQLPLISIGCCYLMGTIIEANFISSVAGNDAWLIGLFGGICFIPVMAIYLTLIKLHPGKHLMQINDAVFGAVGGGILSFLYLIFFISLCALSIAQAGSFLSYFILPDTPLILIVVFFMAACVYCAYMGIASMTRVATLFGAASLAGLLLSMILSFGNADFEHLLPVLRLRPMDYIQSTHIAAAIPFGESIVLLMFGADLSRKASMKKAYIAVTLFTVLIMTLVHLREVVTLGSMSSYATMPSYEAVRMINIAGIIARFESLFALLLVSLTFFKTLILFHVCGQSIRHITRLETYKPLLLMLAAFLSVYTVKAYGSYSDIIVFGTSTAPFIWSFFTMVIPLITLICSAIQRKRRRVKTA